MSKFFALIASKDMSIERVWMDKAMAMHFLLNNDGVKLYHASNMQEARLIMDADGINKIFWLDIKTTDYKAD